MSKGERGQFILCDGEGCQACVPAPVALRPSLSAETQEMLTAKKWLYVTGQGDSRHFCPQCADAYLENACRMENDETLPFT